MREVRQRLKMWQPYVDRASTNQRAMEVANACRFPKCLLDLVKDQRLRVLGHVLRALPEDPMRKITFVPNGGGPVFKPENTMGRPLVTWTIACFSEAWLGVLGCEGPP